MHAKKGGWIPYTKLAVAVIGSYVMLYPLLWMLSASFKPKSEIFRDAGLLPKTVTLENYINGWQGIGGISFGHFFANSFFLVILAIIGNILTCSMAAYAFARLDFSMKKTFFGIMLASLMLPHHVTLIPQYVFFFQLKWIDTYLPLLVPKFLAAEAFFIFLMVQFIRGLPYELDQAATVDGCGPIQTYTRIIFPLLLPALVTTAIFTFIWTWNDFFSQLIYISNPQKLTVTLALRSFLDSMGDSSWGYLFAMSVLSLLPIFLFFVFSQRLLIEGISTTGLKG
jgi:multiple sugar transport system permease protein